MTKIKIEKDFVIITSGNTGRIEIYKDQIHEFSVAINMLAQLIAFGEFLTLEYTLK